MLRASAKAIASRGDAKLTHGLYNVWFLIMKPKVCSRNYEKREARILEDVGKQLLIHGLAIFLVSPMNGFVILDFFQ